MSTAQLQFLRVIASQLDPSTAQLRFLRVNGAPADPAPAITAQLRFLRVAAGPNIVAPAAPATVSGDATSGTAATLTLTGLDSTATGVQWQLSVSGSGSWFDAAGDVNPSGPGTVSFAATGLSPAVVYTPRARASNSGGSSGYTVGSDFGTDNVGTGGGGVSFQPRAALAYVEPGSDQVTLSGGITRPVRSAALAYAEPGVDQVTVQAAITRPVRAAALAFVEPASDRLSAVAGITPSRAAAMAYVEPAADHASVLAHITAASSYNGVLAYVESGADSLAFVATAGATYTQGGMLAELAAEFVELRSASGLFVGYPEVLQCAIRATRFYGGWATITDPSAAGGVFSITGLTRVTMGEWAIIAPLFSLYVERETAIVIESSRVMGVEMVGRGTAEVSQDIAQAEERLSQLAYNEDAFTVGGDPDSVPGPSIYTAYPVGATPFSTS